MTPAQAAIQQELAQAAAAALTRQVEAERQVRDMTTRLAAVEEQLRACLAVQGSKDGDNPDKRARTDPVRPSDPPATVHPSSDSNPTTRTPTSVAFLSAFTGMHGDTTPAVGQRQPASPEPGSDTTGVRGRLFNNQNQATIGQSPRPGTGVPISAVRFNSKDATQVNHHAVLSMAQSLLQSGAVHLTGTHLRVSGEAATHPLLRPHGFGDHDRPGDLAYPQLTNPELSDLSLIHI